MSGTTVSLNAVTVSPQRRATLNRRTLAFYLHNF